jgi:hypothetical protein
MPTKGNQGIRVPAELKGRLQTICDAHRNGHPQLVEQLLDVLAERLHRPAPQLWTEAEVMAVLGVERNRLRAVCGRRGSIESKGWRAKPVDSSKKDWWMEVERI